jgi:hypothetical protein
MFASFDYFTFSISASFQLFSHSAFSGRKGEENFELSIGARGNPVGFLSRNGPTGEIFGRKNLRVSRCRRRNTCFVHSCPSRWPTVTKPLITTMRQRDLVKERWMIFLT